jgi:hypothetical protein
MFPDPLILPEASAVDGPGFHPIRDEFRFVAGILQRAVEPHLAFHVREGAS